MHERDGDRFGQRRGTTALEICLDDIDGAAVAEAAGADRIELCAGLGEGGTTPSIGTVEATLATVERLGVQVLVRQRAGDFVYSDAEVSAMVADIRAISSLSRPSAVTVGFVIGALNPDGTVNRPVTARLVEATSGLPVTFHKAFDQCPDLFVALDELVGLGVGRVLTSGGEVTALAGADRLAALVTHAGDRLTVLAGGGIRPDHAADLVRRTGAQEVHLRAGRQTSSGAAPAQGQTPATKAVYDSGQRMVTDGRLVAAMRTALDTQEGPR